MKRVTGAIGNSAFAFVLTIGIVNLFADMTYEGGASINGPFLGTLGANAAAISIIAGVGEFLGYSLRSVAGYVADKTGRYWLITFSRLQRQSPGGSRHGPGRQLANCGSSCFRGENWTRDAQADRRSDEIFLQRVSHFMGFPI